MNSKMTATAPTHAAPSTTPSLRVAAPPPPRLSTLNAHLSTITKTRLGTRSGISAPTAIFRNLPLVLRPQIPDLQSPANPDPKKYENFNFGDGRPRNTTEHHASTRRYPVVLAGTLPPPARAKPRAERGPPPKPKKLKCVSRVRLKASGVAQSSRLRVPAPSRCENGEGAAGRYPNSPAWTPALPLPDILITPAPKLGLSFKARGG